MRLGESEYFVSFKRKLLKGNYLVVIRNEGCSKLEVKGISFDYELV
jgi:hypothetical protein